MPAQSYHITEPHPSVPASHYMPSGRGGMGNMTHITTKTLTSSTAASRPVSSTAQATTNHGISRLPTSSSAAAAASGGAAAAGKTITSNSRSTNHNYYAAGRGGAGNMHHASHASERPIFSFDEELERQRRMMQHMAPVYHIGRGGAGNYASGGSSEAGSLSRRSSSGSDSIA